MAYGLRVRGANGIVILDTSHWLGRIRYSNVVARDTSGSIDLPDISGRTTYTFSMPLEGENRIAHSVSIAATTFSWTAQSTARQGSGKSLVGVIIED